MDHGFYTITRQALAGYAIAYDSGVGKVVCCLFDLLCLQKLGSDVLEKNPTTLQILAFVLC